MLQNSLHRVGAIATATPDQAATRPALLSKPRSAQCGSSSRDHDDQACDEQAYAEHCEYADINHSPS